MHCLLVIFVLMKIKTGEEDAPHLPSPGQLPSQAGDKYSGWVWKLAGSSRSDMAPSLQTVDWQATKSCVGWAHLNTNAAGPGARARAGGRQGLDAQHSIVVWGGIAPTVVSFLPSLTPMPLLCWILGRSALCSPRINAVVQEESWQLKNQTEANKKATQLRAWDSIALPASTLVSLGWCWRRRFRASVGVC